MPDRLGTAQWEEQTLVSQRYPFEDGKFWLGRSENGTPIGYRDDRHICLVSGSRGGKGTSVIINNLCFWPGSAVVVDPKGENATVTAARRGGKRSGRPLIVADGSGTGRYPGLALVLVTGANPLVVFRENYFEDALFIDAFSPHPDHKFLPALPYSVESAGLWPLLETGGKQQDRHKFTITGWHIRPGQCVFPGQTAAMLNCYGQTPIVVPRTGKVVQTLEADRNSTSSGPYDDALFTIKSYPEDGRSDGIDPFRYVRSARDRFLQNKEQLEKKDWLSSSQTSSNHTFAFIVAGVVCALAVFAVFFFANSHSNEPSHNLASQPSQGFQPLPVNPALTTHNPARKGTKVQTIPQTYASSQIPNEPRPAPPQPEPDAAVTQQDEAASLVDRARNASFGYEADSLYHQAAEMGNVEAIRQTCLRSGAKALSGSAARSPNDPITADEALKWCTQAADSGDGLSMNELGAMYEFGAGVPRDVQQAIRWYRASVATNNPYSVRDAKASLQRLGAQ